MQTVITADVFLMACAADERLNKVVGYDADNIKGYLQRLQQDGRVEAGYRAQCGATHSTAKTFREWTRVVKALRKSGVAVSEESVKHGNAYATNNGGFWNSTIYRIE